MAYTKQNFVDQQVLTAGHLNHIEDGIANAVSKSGDTINGVLNVGDNLKLHSDNEGGNITLYPHSDDNQAEMSLWSIDTNDGYLRIFGTTNDGTNVFPMTINPDGSVYFNTNAKQTRVNLGAAPAGGNTKRHFANIGGSANGVIDYYASMQFIDLGANKYKVHAHGQIKQITAASSTNYTYGVDVAKLLAVINDLYSTSYTSMSWVNRPYAQLFNSNGTIETTGLGYGYLLGSGTSYWAIGRYHNTSGSDGLWDQNLIFNRCGSYGYLEFEAIVQCS